MKKCIKKANNEFITEMKGMFGTFTLRKCIYILLTLAAVCTILGIGAAAVLATKTLITTPFLMVPAYMLIVVVSGGAGTATLIYSEILYEKCK